MGRVDGALTASTLNSDVLPAFWSPIMVMSISVALARDISLGVVAHAYEAHCCCKLMSGGEACSLSSIFFSIDTQQRTHTRTG